MDVSKSQASRSSQEIISALDHKEKLRLSREAEAELGRRDTYYLCKYILGYDKLNTTFHRALCRFYDIHFYDLQLHLHPRKHYKTTILTIVGNMRLALNHPNIAICIMANTVTNAQAFLYEIKTHFIQNDKFRELYPNHAPDKKREEGTSDKFVTPARTKHYIRQGTFEAAGIDRALVSRHFDKIHFDDIVDDKNINTPELRESNYQNYVTSLSVTGLTKKNLPFHHIVGTRWHMDDTYAKILDEQKISGKFHVLITQAYYKDVDEETGEWTTKYLFPEQFPPEALEHLRKTQTDAVFSCLYLNNPVPCDSAALDPNKMRFYKPELINPGPRNKIITVDPSTSYQVRKGDPTVIGCYEMDCDHNVYVTDVLRGWWTAEEIVEKIINCHKAYGIKKIAIEAVAFQRWLCEFVEKRRKDLGLYFQIIPVKRDTGTGKHALRKHRRQEKIIPFHRTGKIFYREDEPELEIIIRELREYPLGRYDDFLDTLCDAIELLTPPPVLKKRPMDYREPPILTHGRNFQTGYSTRSF